MQVGLFTPDMAFEAIVKKQIEELRKPILTCIDLVVQELCVVVRMCTEKVLEYRFQIRIPRVDPSDENVNANEFTR